MPSPYIGGGQLSEKDRRPVSKRYAAQNVTIILRILTMCISGVSRELFATEIIYCQSQMRDVRLFDLAVHSIERVLSGKLTFHHVIKDSLLMKQ